ncbi:MAG TPA: protein arginine kinase [Clostridiaceae bacterium]|jgi:protein arginine kinase|nr:protein arginine kinase [Clostridiaceae bacterium]
MSKWYIDSGPDSDVVVSSRVRLARNYAAYPFPQRSTKEDQENVIIDTCNALFAGQPELKESLTLVRLNDMTTIQKQVLVEKHLVSKELAESSLETCALISDDEQISIMINEEDHLRIQCLKAGMQVDTAFSLCNSLDDTISDRIDYAFIDKIGYLTSCPTNVGTGIRVSIMLHLPALTMTGYIRGFLESCGKLGLAVRGLYGENTEAHGNMFQLSNQITLGKSEKDIVESINSIGRQIIEQERLLRQELLNKNKNKFEDRIMRSYGILKYSRILTLEEALKRLSDIRLGINLGIIKDLSQMDVNEMILMIQPGSLQEYAGELLNAEKRDILRAEFVRNRIGNDKAV